jgi:hypothetical protein
MVFGEVTNGTVGFELINLTEIYEELTRNWHVRILSLRLDHLHPRVIGSVRCCRVSWIGCCCDLGVLEQKTIWILLNLAQVATTLPTEMESGITK